jgi:Bacterial Ig-like domain (group 3)
VTPTGGTGTPTGTVDFTEGAMDLTPGGVTLNGSSVATFTISSLAVGSNAITAAYFGDNNFTSSSGDDSATPQVVNPADTTTTISGPTTVVFGQQVTYTATIAGVSPSAGAPAHGTVTFTIDDHTLVSANVSNGVATDVVTWGNPADGTTHTVDATFNGNDAGDFYGSTATTYRVTEDSDSTTTTVAFSPGSPPRFFGNPVTLTATVAPVGGSGTPTGTVTFKDGSTTLASSVTLNASGVSTFATSALSVGNNTITAVYSGDTDFQGSTSSAEPGRWHHPGGILQSVSHDDHRETAGGEPQCRHAHHLPWPGHVAANANRPPRRYHGTCRCPHQRQRHRWRQCRSEFLQRHLRLWPG